MITKDRQGNAVTGATPEAAELYDNAVAAFQIYSGDPVALADAAIDKAPAFTMAHILKSWLFAVSKLSCMPNHLVMMSVKPFTSLRWTTCCGANGPGRP